MIHISLSCCCCLEMKEDFLLSSSPLFKYSHFFYVFFFFFFFFFFFLSFSLELGSPICQCSALLLHTRAPSTHSQVSSSPPRLLCPTTNPTVLTCTRMVFGVLLIPTSDLYSWVAVFGYGDLQKWLQN